MTRPSAAARAYRLLLLLYPRAFRARFGQDMTDLFLDRLDEARRTGHAGSVAQVVWRVTLDTVTHAWAERRAAHSELMYSLPPAAGIRSRGDLMGTLMQDVVYALRSFVRRPAFTAIAILTLTLGIGSNAAIFSVVHAVLLTPLPYDEPDRLVKIFGQSLKQGEARTNISVPDFADFQKANRTFASMGANASVGAYTLTGEGEAERIRAVDVSSGFFRALGARPALGRIYGTEVDIPNPPYVAVISHGLWTRRFGSDPGIIGRVVSLSNLAFTIVAVLRPDFRHPEPDEVGEPDIWTPLDFDPAVSSRSGRFIRGIGRLRPNVAIEGAQADLTTIARQLEQQYPRTNFDRGVDLTTLSDAIVGRSRTALLMLLGAVAFVLLIACANLANLLVASGAARQKEMAIRAALGAGRRRIVRQLLTESLVLSGIGGLGGLALGAAATRVLVRLSDGSIPRAEHIAMDTTVTGFAALITLATGLLFGVLPALHGSRTDVQGALKDGARGSVEGAPRAQGRAMLIAAEVALAVMLLIGAGLLIRSFWQLERTTPGFSAERVMTFQMSLPRARYAEGTQNRFYEDLYPRIAALPGVRVVGATSILPLSGNYSCDGIQIDARPLPEGQNPCAEARSVSPDYFRAMGIPSTRGRLFTSHDSADAPRVVVINETMARKFWPGEDPVGKTMTYTSRGQSGSREIVGVIADVRHFGPQADVPPEFYTPQAQPPSFHSMTLVVRADADPTGLTPAIRAQIAGIDNQVPIYNVRTLDELVWTSVAAPRFRTVLLGLFAAVALLLALVGIYGVIAYTVRHRTREIGVRMALGAQPGDVLRLFLFESLRPVLAGLVVGLASSLAVADVLSSLLFGVSTRDPLTFLVVPALLLAAALMATWAPARRATRIDPMLALRMD